MTNNFTIRQATVEDVGIILKFIKELAQYEKLAHEVIATEAILKDTLFGERAYAEVVFGCIDQEPVGFALFFHNYSTFLGKPGIYLEDLYVKPEARNQGIGQKLLAYLARLVKIRNCGRLEWWVLDWNQAATHFYEKMGAIPMNEWTVFRLTGEALDQLAATFED